MTEKPRQTLAAPFVASGAGRLREALLVRPGAGIALLPPLQAEPSPIVERAKEQFEILVRTLRDNGVDPHVIEVDDPTGYAALVNDCAIVLEKGAVILRPSRAERRAQVPAVEAMLVDLGVPILGRIDAPGLLDGGDLALGAGVVYVGVPAGDGPPRSNTFGRAQFEEIAVEQRLRVVELPLAATVPRLCSVFTPLGENVVVAAPDYVDTVPLGSAVTIVAIPRGDQFGAGLLVLGPRRAIANLRFRVALPLLRKAKIDLDAIDLWEFGKAGISPQSLVLALKRG